MARPLNVTTRKRKKRYGRFARLAKGGPAAHKEAVRRANQAVAIAERRIKAYALLRRGATFAEIGKALKVSGKTAWEDCIAYRKGLLEGGILDGGQMVIDQQVDLDHVKAVHRRTVQKRDSWQALLAALEREAKLHGLDKRQAGVPMEQVMAMSVGFARDILEIISDVAQRRAIMRAIQKRMGVAATQAIDVTPAKDDGGSE